jgi:hypothetical protein
MKITILGKEYDLDVAKAQEMGCLVEELTLQPGDVFAKDDFGYVILLVQHYRDDDSWMAIGNNLGFTLWNIDGSVFCGTGQLKRYLVHNKWKRIGNVRLEFDMNSKTVKLTS